MPNVLNDEKTTELWKAFHTDNLLGPNTQKAIENQLRLREIQGFYNTDDIFRREIDFLREKMTNKKIKFKETEKKIEQFLKEAQYRRYIATFENMKQNYQARKSQMTKIQEALQ